MKKTGEERMGGGGRRLNKRRHKSTEERRDVRRGADRSKGPLGVEKDLSILGI